MLGAAYVEYIHDELVSKLWLGGDPVAAWEYRDQGLLESAVSRPFHSAFGNDVYPSVNGKAAALFHSLIANHPFHNGNKRTAVLAVDIFLVANGYFCVLPNGRMYQLAAQTASYRQRGLSHEQSLQEILAALNGLIIPLSELRKEAEKEPTVARLYRAAMRTRRRVRRNRLNRSRDSD